MNQLRRKGRSKCRNSKRRNSRMKTRVKRQYKRKTSRVKRNTYRKNRKRHTKRRVRGGSNGESSDSSSARPPPALLQQIRDRRQTKKEKVMKLLYKWEGYQNRTGAFKHWEESGIDLEERPVALGARSVYYMDLGNGSLRKEAERDIGKRERGQSEEVYELFLQSNMNEYLEEIMLNFPSLKYLDISDNGLESLPSVIVLLSNLKFLNIQGNPKLLYDSKTIRLIQELMKRYNEESVQVLKDSKGARPKN